MGRIEDLTKYPIDQDLSGSEYWVGTDPDNNNATRNYSATAVAKFTAKYLERLKNPTSSLYDGFIIIAREGAGKDNTIVQQNDILIGRNSTFFSGDLVVLTANQDSPTQDSHFTVKINLM